MRLRACPQVGSCSCVVLPVLLCKISFFFLSFCFLSFEGVSANFSCWRTSPVGQTFPAAPGILNTVHGRESSCPGPSPVTSAVNLSWRELRPGRRSWRVSLLGCVGCVMFFVVFFPIVSYSYFISTYSTGVHTPLMYSQFCRVTSVHERPPSLLQVTEGHKPLPTSVHERTFASCCRVMQCACVRACPELEPCCFVMCAVVVFFSFFHHFFLRLQT